MPAGYVESLSERRASLTGTILCEDVFVENGDKPFDVNICGTLWEDVISTVIPTS